MFKISINILLFLIVVLSVTASLQKELELLKKQNDLLSLELNENNVATAIMFYDIHNPDIVYKQALLESGKFKSKLATSGNNLFGLRVPGQRTTLATGKYKGYAKFKHWSHSVLEYKLWQMQRPLKQKEDYFSYLKNRKYATNPSYATHVKTQKISNDISKIFTKTL